MIDQRLCACGHSLDEHDHNSCTGWTNNSPLSGGCACKVYVYAVANVDTTATTTTHDPVSAPSHYTRFPNGVQPIDLLEHLPFNLGAAGKYILRAGHKGPAAEDIRKAIWFLERELKRVSK
jgi:hypothetical protein